MTVYDLESIDPEAINTSHTQVAELVGRDKTVLDVGCSTGDLGRFLGTQGCTVDGVEVDEEAAQMASKILRRVAVVDLDREDLVAAMDGARYDCIVFADVLEHLMDPATVLRSAISLLAPDGAIVISVPNVAHGALRLALLQGRWDYRTTGLLDNTHVRFFTRDSILDLVRGAGLAVAEIRATINDPLRTEVEVDVSALPPGLVEWVRMQPRSFDYQYILRATLGGPGEPPVVVPVTVLPEMEESQRHAQILQSSDLAQLERLDLYRKVLTLRDHVVGTEAELGHSRTEFDRMQGERDLALSAAHEMRMSASWRLGHMLVAPLSGVRRLWRGR